jgi:hypothetical protein
LTEQAWLNSTDPQAMLTFLRDSGKLSDRKARLFAVACCRRIWHLLTDERSHKAVEAADRFAEGSASEEEFEEVRFAATDHASVETEGTPSYLAALAAGEAATVCCWDDFGPTEEEAYGAAKGSVHWCSKAVGHVAFGAASAGPEVAQAAAMRQECEAQCRLIHDLFGNPLLPPADIAPSLLAWNDGTVTLLAHAAYAERSMPGGTLAPQRLAVLSDALEEAGADAGLVDHLRRPGPHYRGCHALDLILGKE